jgi:hypothetical protein
METEIRAVDKGCAASWVMCCGWLDLVDCMAFD